MYSLDIKCLLESEPQLLIQHSFLYVTTIYSTQLDWLAHGLKNLYHLTLGLCHS